jgi:hypothetical protein
MYIVMPGSVGTSDSEKDRGTSVRGAFISTTLSSNYWDGVAYLQTVFTSVADPGCLSWILIFPIPDPKTATKKRGEKTYPGSRGQKVTGSRIQGSKRHWIPDPGVKKAPDPGSATLVFTCFLPK